MSFDHVLRYCPHCAADRENFEKNYFEGDGEMHEYTVCTACGNLITSFTIHDDLRNSDEQKENCSTLNTSNSCNINDQDKFGAQSDEVIDISDITCKIDLTDDDGCTKSQPLFFNNNNRQLRNSCSTFSFEEKQNTTVADKALATLDNGELSRESLRLARQVHCQHLSCIDCSNPGSQILPVEGMKDIFHCSSCFSVHGVDDSMNYYDLLQKGNYIVEACIMCGNSDPNLFLLECGSSTNSVNLRCVQCSDMAHGAEDRNVLGQNMKEYIHYECKCSNSNSVMQKIDIDESSNTVFVKCLICQREDMIALPYSGLKPSICTCSDECVDMQFDEYGYVSRLVCVRCKAEMDCGISGAADVAAAGDGRSMGRTRITSLTDIQIGDHIAWHQFLGYWHHAIVTEVSGGQIRVIHYNGPNLPNKGMVCNS